jgi:hypothetical protein
VHFVKTPDYVQVTGVGDFTKINVLQGDAGGELDNRGADGMCSDLYPFVYIADVRCAVQVKETQVKCPVLIP